MSLLNVALGHCDEGDLSDKEHTPCDVREMEPEAVALLCCESLGLAGVEYRRGYIQSLGPGPGLSATGPPNESFTCSGSLSRIFNPHFGTQSETDRLSEAAEQLSRSP